MCYFWSAIVTKSPIKVLHLKDSMHHEDIIDECDLYDGIADRERMMFASVEFSHPKDIALLKDATQWELKIDEKIRPEWWAPAHEKACRKCLQDLINEHWASYSPSASPPPREEPDLKVGDKVIVIAATHGWGEVLKGDRGVVTALCKETEGPSEMSWDSDPYPVMQQETKILYYVDFPDHDGWMGYRKCFEFEEVVSTS